MDSKTGLQKILIFSDLDRTIIPNGFREESAQARPVLRRIAEYPHIYLVYVSGGDKKFILAAIEEVYLPTPDYIIGMSERPYTVLYRAAGYCRKIGAMGSPGIGKDRAGKNWQIF